MPTTIISETDQELLAQLPETGMGYQFLKLPSDNYLLVIATSVAVVFRTRADLFEQLANLGPFQGPNDWQSSRDQLVDRWSISAEMLIDREDPAVVNILRAGPRRQGRSKSIELIHDVPTLAEPRMFFRFSALPTDPRIGSDGSFTAGTYATTFNDLRLVPSGLAAVGRYALPSPQSARFCFSIVTNSPHKLGTSLPNFGQAGGGVEVKFHNGAMRLPQSGHPMDLG